MRALSEQEILERAEEIKNKQAKSQKEVYEHDRDKWLRSKIGKYYKIFHTGAHDEAFKMIFVRCDGGWGYDETLEIMFSHIGHYSMS